MVSDFYNDSSSVQSFLRFLSLLVGLSSVCGNISRRRSVRFYMLHSIFAHLVRKNIAKQSRYIIPMPPSVELYMRQHAVCDSKMLTDMWLDVTTPIGAISETLMRQVVCNKVIRMDHSQKFCKKLKLYGSSGTKASVGAAKHLLLLMAESGQIMARSFTRSENNDETKMLYKDQVMGRFDDGDTNLRYVISDNANAVRKMVKEISGGRHVVKQDVWHVIHRLTEKLKSKKKQKWFAKALSKAIYKENGELKSVEEMYRDVKAAAGEIKDVDVKSVVEWNGCVESNLDQIKKGDLSVDSNFYCEENNVVKIVSTSQLEGFHAQLKKVLNRSVSYEVGVRILDIFILQVICISRHEFSTLFLDVTLFSPPSLHII